MQQYDEFVPRVRSLQKAEEDARATGTCEDVWGMSDSDEDTPAPLPPANSSTEQLKEQARDLLHRPLKYTSEQPSYDHRTPLTMCFSSGGYLRDITSSKEAESQEQRTHTFPALHDPASIPEDEQQAYNRISDAQHMDRGNQYLRRHGWQFGQGLGRNRDGALLPVVLRNHSTRGGVGFKTDIEARSHKYEEAEVHIVIHPEWCDPPPDTPLPTKDDTASWMNVGPRSEQITDPAFCDLELQNLLFNCKTLFDNVKAEDFRSARDRANPFEEIKKEWFQNRAALKMCEMDAICDRIFTQPACLSQVAQRSDSSSDSKKRELLYFADICAGPGGFTEYFLNINKWRSKGFGFTLKNAEDFRPAKFNSNAPPHSFKSYYGADGTGDITATHNMVHFRKQVLKETHKRGVHVVMADGGFNVNTQWNKQELLSRQLVLCQFATALSILREGGVFVCKVFDTFLPFTVALLYILRIHFHEFCLLKPNQSRPANSEKYVVCKGLKCRKPTIVAYLWQVNERINELKQATDGDALVLDVLEVVPRAVMHADQSFCTYIKRWNENNARRQVKALQRLRKYVEDRSLQSDNQQRIRQECIRFWFQKGSNPSSGRAADSEDYVQNDDHFGRRLTRVGPPPANLFQLLHDKESNSAVKELLKRLDYEKTSMSSFLTPQMVEPGAKLRDPHLWKCVVLPNNGGRGQRGGQGGARCLLVSNYRHTYMVDRDSLHFFVQELQRQELVLPPDTMLDVVRTRVPGSSFYDYHVVDGWFLGGDVIFKRDFEDRQNLLEMFVESLRQPHLLYPGLISIPHLLQDTRIAKNHATLAVYFLKNESGKKAVGRPLYCCEWRGCGAKSDVLSWDRLVASLQRLCSGGASGGNVGIGVG